MYYYLGIDERTAVACDFADWLILVDSPSHQLAVEVIGATRITTCFTGIDPYYTPQVTPLLFTTYLQGGEWAGEECFYESFEEAISGHQRFCQVVMNLSNQINGSS